MEKIYIVIGCKLSRERFTDFYTQSIFLMKNGLLKSASKASLTLETGHFNIRFMPNTTISALHGIRCTWAYGFSPEMTNYLEFRTKEQAKAMKPLVENIEELFKRIAEMEDAYGD